MKYFNTRSSSNASVNLQNAKKRLKYQILFKRGSKKLDSATTSQTQQDRSKDGKDAA